MRLSASQQILAINYFLMQNRYNLMVWALALHTLDVIEYASKRAHHKKVSHQLLNVLFKDTLSENWHKYTKGLNAEEVFGKDFFDINIFPRIAPISTLKHPNEFYDNWKTAQWSGRDLFSNHLRNVIMYVESKHLISLRKTNEIPTNIVGTYRQVWNESFLYFPKNNASKFEKIYLNTFKYPNDYGVKSYIFFSFLIGLSSWLYRKINEHFPLYSSYIAIGLGVFAFRLLYLVFKYGSLPSYININLNLVKSFANNNAEALEAAFEPEMHIIGLIQKIIDDLRPKEPTKKPKQISGTHTHSKVTSSRLQFPHYPVSTAEAPAERRIYRLFKRATPVTVEAPRPIQKKKIETFHCIDSSGNQRRVYPFGKVFVADLLNEDAQEAGTRITSLLEKVLQDGRIIPKSRLGQTGLKIYSNKETDQGALAVLKLDRRLCFACDAERVTVTGSIKGEIPAALVYIPGLCILKNGAEQLAAPRPNNNPAPAARAR